MNINIWITYYIITNNQSLRPSMSTISQLFLKFKYTVQFMVYKILYTPQLVLIPHKVIIYKKRHNIFQVLITFYGVNYGRDSNSVVNLMWSWYLLIVVEVFITIIKNTISKPYHVYYSKTPINCIPMSHHITIVQLKSCVSHQEPFLRWWQA